MTKNLLLFMTLSVAFVVGSAQASPLSSQPPSNNHPQQDQTQQEQVWLQKWEQEQRQNWSASQWAISYDLIEVVAQPTASSTPLLPAQSLQRDSSAIISRLSVAQVVNKDKKSVHTVFADITLPYLLEIQSPLYKGKHSKRSKQQPSAYIYKLSDQGMVKIPLPQSKATDDIVEMASSADEIWKLMHVDVGFLDIVAWDEKGRPTEVIEKKSPLSGKIYLYYHNNQTTPYMLQSVDMMENGKEKTSTILVYKIDEQGQKDPWNALDILKSATQQFLVP